MIRELFSPIGTIERTALLRVCGALYLAQIVWAVLVFVFLYFLTEGRSDPTKLLITSSYFVFLYLFMCAFSKRLQSLAFSRLWLIPVAATFCIALIITATVSVDIIPINISHFMDKNYLMILLYTLLNSIVAFSGGYIVSIAMAFLPKRRRPPEFAQA